MATQNDVIKFIMTMAEMHQRPMPEASAKLYLEMIGGFPPDVIMASLRECGRKIPRFPTAAEVVQRCEAMDGRPGVEEAWAMIPKDEYGSVVWTQEMATAFGACGSLMNTDLVAARMAFKEAYDRELNLARQQNRKVQWVPSFGFEKRGREAAVVKAMELGRITKQVAIEMLPDSDIVAGSRENQSRIQQVVRAALENKTL